MTQTPTVQHSVIDLISQAGLMVQFVLLLLLLASVISWAIIFTKWRILKRASHENESFLETFWHGKNIDEILSKTDQFPASPVAAVFKSGVKELKKLSNANDAASSIGGSTEGVENVQRALLRSANSEVAGLEKHVGVLATTASAGPFVGLFGTVWGIMNSFQSIGATGAASLAVVAPGISEALIATAMGLAAAIPAVMAYNHFAGQIRRHAVDMECFSQDFLNIIQRSMLNGKKGT
jgi:biopolymer transport protein TolQ